MTTTVRKGQWPGNLERIEFSRRIRDSFVDHACELKAELADLARPRRKIVVQRSKECRGGLRCATSS